MRDSEQELLSNEEYKEYLNNQWLDCWLDTEIVDWKKYDKMKKKKPKFEFVDESFWKKLKRGVKKCLNITRS